MPRVEVMEPQVSEEVTEAAQEALDHSDDVVVVESGDTTEVLEEVAGDVDSPAGADDTSEEVIVSIGDEQPEPEEDTTKAPKWVKELRHQFRELQKEKKELEAKLAAVNGSKPEAGLPKKPTLEEFDYNADKFESALVEWHEKKRQHDIEQERIKSEQEAREQEWQSRLDAYHKSKTELKVKDFDAAESVILEKFTETQQGILVQGLENPALMIYALGKNLKKVEELSKISDPVRFAIAVGKLESQLKVTSRKTPPAPPPRVVGGSAPVSGAIDQTLERLRAEAERTGDYTKVIKYKKQKTSK